MADYTQRVFHGTSQRWQGGFPRATMTGNATGEPWYGGQVYFSSSMDEPRNFYMKTIEDSIKQTGKGTVYATDIDPDDFYNPDLPLNKQSPKVQEAIKNIAKNNPSGSFRVDGSLKVYPEIGAARQWNQVMDDLYGYGIKGLHITPEGTSDEWVFRYAKDVPVVQDTYRGTNLIPELSQPVNKIVRAAQPAYVNNIEPAISKIGKSAKNLMSGATKGIKAIAPLGDFIYYGTLPMRKDEILKEYNMFIDDNGNITGRI